MQFYKIVVALLSSLKFTLVFTLIPVSSSSESGPRGGTGIGGRGPAVAEETAEVKAGCCCKDLFMVWRDLTSICNQKMTS